MLESKLISEEKKEIVRNLYESGIAEDLEIPTVINILKEIGIYKGTG